MIRGEFCLFYFVFSITVQAKTLLAVKAGLCVGLGQGEVIIDPSTRGGSLSRRLSHREATHWPVYVCQNADRNDVWRIVEGQTIPCVNWHAVEQSSK